MALKMVFISLERCLHICSKYLLSTCCVIWLSLKELKRSGVSRELFPLVDTPLRGRCCYLLTLLYNSQLFPYSTAFLGGNRPLTYGLRHLLYGADFPNCITCTDLFPQFSPCLLESAQPGTSSWKASMSKFSSKPSPDLPLSLGFLFWWRHHHLPTHVFSNCYSLRTRSVSSATPDVRDLRSTD